MHISTWFVLRIYPYVAPVQMRITMQAHNSSDARPFLYTQTDFPSYVRLYTETNNQAILKKTLPKFTQSDYASLV